MTTSTPATPARRRATTWLALGLLALALGMVVFLWVSMYLLPGWEVLSSRPRSMWELATLTTQTIAFVTLPTVGALLVAQRPRNAVGWIMLASGIGFASGVFANAYVDRSLVLDDLTGYALVDWLGAFPRTLGFLLLVIWLPMVFPDGRLPGPRWRPVAAGAAVFVAGALAYLVIDEANEDRLLPNPMRLDDSSSGIVSLLDLLINPLLIAFIVLAFTSVAVRFRGSTGIERQQLKWFLAGVGLLAMVVPVTAATGIDRQGPPAYVAFAFLPIAIGIAVLRYRLYEIDRLISRTIGWALVTALLVGTFAVLVLGSSAVLEPLTGGNTLAVAGATLVVVALFAPLRSRVQRAVDRRFDRARYDGERLVGAFGERLRDEVDLETIRTDVLGTVDAAVRPASMGLWLRERPRAGR